LSRLTGLLYAIGGYTKASTCGIAIFKGRSSSDYSSSHCSLKNSSCSFALRFTLFVLQPTKPNINLIDLILYCGAAVFL